MADFVSSLIVKLIDQVTGPAKQIASAIRGIGTAAKGGDITINERLDAALARNNARIARFRSGMVDAVATAYLLKQALSTPIQSAQSFEAALTELQNKSGLSSAEIKKLGDQMRALAGPTNQLSSDLLKGLDILVGFGVPAGQASDAMSTIGRASTATGASIDDMSKLAYAALSNLKVPTAELVKAFDILDYAGKQGGFELRDMAQYFPELGAAAQAMGQQGVSAVSDMGAALQIVRRGTGDAAQAANDLANLYQKMRAPLTQKNFEGFGINIRKEIDKGVKSGRSPIEVVLEQTKRAIKKGAILEDLFADKQVQEAMRPLLAYTEDYVKLREAAAKQSGIVDSDFAAKMKTNAEVMKGFNVALNEFSVTLGNVLLPALTKVMQVLTPIIDKMSQWVEKHPQIAAGLVGVATALTAFNIVAMTVGYTTSVLYGAFLGLAKGVASLMGLGAAAGGLVALAAALIAAAGAAYYFRDEIGKMAGVSGDTAFAALYPMIAAYKALGDSARWAGESIASALMGIDWSGSAAAVQQWVSSMLSGIQSGNAMIVSALMGSGAQFMAAVRSGLGSLYSIGVEWMNSLLDGIMAGVSRIIGAVAGVGSRIKSAISGAVGGGSLSSPTGGGGGWGGERAGGGPVSAGQRYLVGEKGPEVVEFGKSGRVHPNSSLGGGGATISPTFNVSVNGGGNAAEIAAAVKRVLTDEVREAFRGVYSDAGMRFA